MAFRKGKPVSFKDQLENAGYVKMDKGTITPGEGILIHDVLIGESTENGTFVYVSGVYKMNKVYVSVPTSSVDDFKEINAEDLDEIRKNEYHMYIEKKTSKENRDYFIAYIDD